MEDIIIFGAGGHAKVVIDIVERQRKYNVVGIFVDTEFMIGKTLLGYPVLDKINNFYGSEKGVIAIGDNYSRHLVAKRIKGINNNFEFISAIHPSSTIGKNVKIGGGTIIVGGVTINADAEIGEHCIINTNSSVGHDVVVDDYSTIAPGSSIGGNSTIGFLSTVAMGSTVLQKIKIGNGTLIGAGSTVINDIPNKVLAFGSPAQIVKKREINEGYL